MSQYYNMRIYRKTVLEHSIVVEDLQEDEYDRLVVWIRENIPSTERKTPHYKAGKLRFGFTHEEHAMAFKLMLPADVIK